MFNDFLSLNHWWKFEQSWSRSSPTAKRLHIFTKALFSYMKDFKKGPYAYVISKIYCHYHDNFGVAFNFQTIRINCVHHLYSDNKTIYIISASKEILDGHYLLLTWNMSAWLLKCKFCVKTNWSSTDDLSKTQKRLSTPFCLERAGTGEDKTDSAKSTD